MQEIQVNEITKLTPTKSNIKRAADILSAAVKDGYINPVEAAIKLKFMQDVLDAAYKEIMPELMNNVKNKTTYLGATLEPAETGTKYDYSSNEIWKSIEAELAPILARKKDIEDKIKMATKINSDILQGDEIIASPVTKESTTSIKITLGK